jgi:phosphate starvation-inducible protein PhoH and related proteins
MNEKTLVLGGIDPVELFGVNNSKIALMQSAFPKIKIIARDNSVRLIGDQSCVLEFEQKFAYILEHYRKYSSLSLSTLQDMLLSPFSACAAPVPEDGSDVLVFGHSGKLIRARTDNQRALVKMQQENDLVFAIGPAGTGKTYTAVALAVKALKNKEVKRIILCRPAVEAEEKLGFLPGNLQDKLDPYLQPLYDALYDMLHPRKLEELVADKIIQVAPLAYMRGRTLDSAFVILDEAQNATLGQLKMFLTRMGENAKFIVTGDVTQIDLPDKSKSGLPKTLEVLKGITGAGQLFFDRSDIIRHRLVKEIVRAFDY